MSPIEALQNVQLPSASSQTGPVLESHGESQDFALHLRGTLLTN